MMYTLKINIFFITALCTVNIPCNLWTSQKEESSVLVGKFKYNLPIFSIFRTCVSKPGTNLGAFRSFFTQGSLNCKTIFNVKGLAKILGSSKAQSLSLPHYDFYYISEMRADNYLLQARELLKKYYTISSKDPLNKELIQKIVNLQLNAIAEYGKWIIPSLKGLKNRFDTIDQFKNIFSWDQKDLSKINYKVESNHDIVNYNKLEMVPDSNSPYEYRISLTDRYIIFPVLFDAIGFALIDKDTIKGTLAHEAHHIIKFDSFWRMLDELHGVDSTKRAMQQEIDADAYACSFSESACLGIIKYFSAHSKAESIGFLRDGESHYKDSSQRVQCAVNYAQKIWKISPEECQKHILDGEALAIHFWNQHLSKFPQAKTLKG